MAAVFERFINIIGAYIKFITEQRNTFGFVVQFYYIVTTSMFRPVMWSSSGW
jgi:hypothetical protein